MLSVSFCAAGVHDSYWTHACDVDLMNQILREKFVELYETPILEKVILLILSIGHKLIRFSMYPSHYYLFLHIQKHMHRYNEDVCFKVCAKDSFF